MWPSPVTSARSRSEQPACHAATTATSRTSMHSFARDASFPATSSSCPGVALLRRITSEMYHRRTYLYTDLNHIDPILILARRGAVRRLRDPAALDRLIVLTDRSSGLSALTIRSGRFSAGLKDAWPCSSSAREVWSSWFPSMNHSSTPLISQAPSTAVRNRGPSEWAGKYPKSPTWMMTAHPARAAMSRDARPSWSCRECRRR